MSDSVKLFIKNDELFQGMFPEGNSHTTTKEIHKKAYNFLIKSVIDGMIPIHIIVKCGSPGDAIFKFKGVQSNVYFYEFLNIAR